MVASIYDKIAVELGQAAPEPSSPEGMQWEQWVEDATLLITDRATKLGYEVPPQAKLDYVVRQAVVAHIKKPDDSTQVTISVDDGSSSRTYQSSKGRVTIDDEWWTFLGLVAASGGAYAVDTTNASDRHLPWCSRNLGAVFCSCGADLTGIGGGPLYEGGEGA
jgi:hypothetical protein